jgi:hypothetical protein
MNINFLSFDHVHRLGESATGAIAHFSGPLAFSVFQWNTLLLAECSPRRWSRGFRRYIACLRNSFSVQGRTPTLQGHGRRA